MSKNYAVVLAEGAQEMFPAEFVHVIHASGGLCYFLAKEIEPNGSFFHMVLDATSSNIPVEMQLHIPHGYIRYVLAANDIKALGFI